MMFKPEYNFEKKMADLEIKVLESQVKDIIPKMGYTLDVPRPKRYDRPPGCLYGYQF